MSEPSHPFLSALHRYSRIGAARRRAAIEAPAQAQTDSVHSLPAGAVLRYLPVVGLIVALCQVLVYGLTSLLLPHAVAVLLTLAAGLLLTAAVHERGAARWWERASDAAQSLQHRLAAGTVGLIVVLLARFETLASLDESWLAATLVCAASASRGLAVLGVAGRTTDSTAAPISRTDGMTLAVMRGISRHYPGAGSETLSVMQQVTEVAWLIGMLAVLGMTAADLNLEDGDS